MTRIPDNGLVGVRVGVYHILSPLGAGGMGEVYRARDTRLSRDVALKMLPPDVTADPDRVARFEREAMTLAALNHPNIGAIYDVEHLEPGTGPDRGNGRALVLELVEGDTLAERIRECAGRTGAGLPVNDVLTIARQIADALDAAHEKGIVHRDLKPANIKITPEGLVKVLDFGLAKLVAAVEPSSTTTTIAGGRTREGILLGTAAYMSPEQARGQTVDKRTDIWAFGCVLYELLTGRVAFAGETIPDTLAAILEREPDWDAVPRSTSTQVQRLLRRCLAKDSRQRLRDVGDARLYLDEVTGDAGAGRPTQRPAQTSRSIRKWAVIGVTAAAVAAGGAITWMLPRHAPPSESGGAARLTIALAPGQELDTRGGAGPLAIAPDGRQVAYVANGGRAAQLHLRSVESFDARAIPATDGAQFPFFSPDSEWVAFFADRKLKRVAVRGGAPVTICDVAVLGQGGAWGPDGTIVFDPGDYGLMRVPASGGVPQRITVGDDAIDRSHLSWPHFLPSGRSVIATVGPLGAADSYLVALALDKREWRRLTAGSQAQYMRPGYLVYHAPAVQEGEIDAVWFDEESLTIRGAPVAAVDSVFRAQNGGAAYFATAQNGTLIFTSGGNARTLVRVDRNGRRSPLTDDRRGFRHPEISPDGRKVAVTVDPRPSQVWVYDLERRTGIPISRDGHSLGPVWSSDGRHVTYSSNLDIFWRLADASGPASRLLTREGSQYPTSWTRDGQLLLYDDGAEAAPNSSDIWLLPTSGTPRPLIATPHEERAARVSPDGRWVSYHSDESGRLEVYVRPFPNVNGGKWLVSTAGGRRPVWSRSGRELFYALGSSLMRVPIATRGAEFVAGSPEALFSGPFDLTTTDFSVAPDSTAFIMVESDPSARPTQVRVVINWREELAARLPRPR